MRRLLPVCPLPLCLLALACGSAAPTPDQLYRLHVPAAAHGATRSAPRLRLAGVSVSPALSGDRLQVAASDVRMEPYVSHRWAGPLELLLEETAARALAPILGTDPGLPGLFLHVHEFCQVEGPASWSGQVAVSAELVQGGTPLWRQEFGATEPAGARHPEAVVEALSRAWTRVLGEVAARAGQ